jgi:hypothetical protein
VLVAVTFALGTLAGRAWGAGAVCSTATGRGRGSGTEAATATLPVSTNTMMAAEILTRTSWLVAQF